MMCIDLSAGWVKVSGWSCLAAVKAWLHGCWCSWQTATDRFLLKKRSCRLNYLWGLLADLAAWLWNLLKSWKSFLFSCQWLSLNNNRLILHTLPMITYSNFPRERERESERNCVLSFSWSLWTFYPHNPDAVTSEANCTDDCADCQLLIRLSSLL